ncbi:MAG: NAD(P)-dependent oxidoreductase [Candidatus Hermodarchaeia archaeon]
MTSINVLFLWDVPSLLRTRLQERLCNFSSLKLIFPEKADEDEFMKYAPSAHIIVGWRPSTELLECAKNLKLFIFPGAGVQHLVKWFNEQGRSRGITFVNGHSNSIFVAQHVVAMLLSLLNNIVPHHNWMATGDWRKGDAEAKNIPMKERTVGLLGYGAINQKVHTLLSGFDVTFAILRRSWAKKDITLPTSVKKYLPSQLEKFLDEVNTLIVALPLTPETEGLLSYNELIRLGENGVVVNVARGSIIDQTALFQVLKEKKIAGAAIDVWYTYQPEPDKQGRKYPYEKPFHTLDNILLSPHHAASPFDDLDRWDEIIDNITRFAQGRNDFINVVDVQRGY